MHTLNLLPDIKLKTDRYKLGMGLARAGLKESLHKFIKNVTCEDERLTIVFCHNMAKFEFEQSKEQFLESARVYYKTHARDFKTLNFIPKRIEAKVDYYKKPSKYDPFAITTQLNPPAKKATSQFQNKATNPLVHAGFERLREIIKKQGE
ncbi:hypothetical protein GZ989_003885 [Campylobacter fetus]|uniref:hypothetical protein n=2 Tax=Campylobacter fetus TaxID=196 RepID=UPI0003D8FC87|nr:hypothetical protein [Campylobacter fetus]OCS20171.1 hypothetical protein CFVI97532_10105 [Campylobacter fetus subsp. venerealis cfvi97/532]OCS43089.1 hypothetical protein CFVI02298_01195 [Campylobacter fetus subsp. venerealis cfvi02/298]AHE94377.1 hypothetical protein CFVI03293_1072 [Campylobacter fetus subsp. venerealis cfvi03/293]EAI3887240.1 hypothetical protein [Campylobacter fetus]KAA3684808.1 hypothetical protein E3G72_04275 [Campylobacter fetus subsp. fetus]